MSGDHVVTVEEFMDDAMTELTDECGTFPEHLDIPLLFCDGDKTYSILSTYPMEHNGEQVYMVDIAEVES